jgi:hypothetical protein
MRPGLGCVAVPIVLAGVLAGALLIGAIGAGVAARTGPAVSPEDGVLLSTDQAFFSAVARSDRAGATKMLDSDFTWTDAAGRTLTRTQLLKTLLPMPAAMSGGQAAEDRRYNYGDVAVLETDHGKIHTLRIWIKRPAGWKGIVYQEVRSLDAPPRVTPGVDRYCLNPCKEIPYTPHSAAQRSVVSAYQEFARAGLARNTTEWGASTADEYVVASSYSDRLMDKKTRMAEMARSNLAGVAPTLVVSAQMFDYPGVEIMKSEQQPDHGKPLHVTRVWVNRGGRWLITLSYQTAIASAEGAP